MTKEKKENQEITGYIEKYYVMSFRWKIQKHQENSKDILGKWTMYGV